MSKFLKNKRGFTLFELIVVIAIIGILAAIAVSVYPGIMARKKLDVAKAKASDIYVVAASLNTMIQFGTVTIGSGQMYANTQAALNSKLDPYSQITSTIASTAWSGLTADGNYIEVNTANKIVAVYVIKAGAKAKWISTGYVTP